MDQPVADGGRHMVTLALGLAHHIVVKYTLSNTIEFA